MARGSQRRQQPVLLEYAISQRGCYWKLFITTFQVFFVGFEFFLNNPNILKRRPSSGLWLQEKGTNAEDDQDKNSQAKITESCPVEMQPSDKRKPSP